MVRANEMVLPELGHRGWAEVETQAEWISVARVAGASCGAAAGAGAEMRKVAK